MRLLLLLFLVLLMHFTHFSAGKQPRIPEYQALLALKTAITDDPQLTLASWNISTSHCTWNGVTCDKCRHVTSLDISGFNLTGTLPPEVGNLRFLQNLSVAVNQFTGPIPVEISFIPNLAYANLSNNIFDDQPSSSPRRELFDGRIPPEYGRFPSLEYLAVSGNELMGEIPPEIGNITTLQQLYVGCYNTFSGNSTKLKLQNLDTLFLQVNSLAGSLTLEIGCLKA
ncbi:hypothetical protein HAX54_016521 [Datura stramonium]|uniref:Leucine-rich repeat-containing N-terminal plant-type domain-containing protein n=1 Tax=Datura stramonium TaxID=4076 RepID=A0ABS8RZZ7_DATST|nr:hypothetical protein [Datura stramonium]